MKAWIICQLISQYASNFHISNRSETTRIQSDESVHFATFTPNSIHAVVVFLTTTRRPVIRIYSNFRRTAIEDWVLRVRALGVNGVTRFFFKKRERFSMTGLLRHRNNSTCLMSSCQVPFRYSHRKLNWTFFCAPGGRTPAWAESGKPMLNCWMPTIWPPLFGRRRCSSWTPRAPVTTWSPNGTWDSSSKMIAYSAALGLYTAVVNK